MICTFINNYMFVYLLLLFVVLDNNSLSYMPGTVFGGIFLGFRFRLPEGCGRKPGKLVCQILPGFTLASAESSVAARIIDC